MSQLIGLALFGFRGGARYLKSAVLSQARRTEDGA